MTFLDVLQEDKIFLGLAILLSNVGGRYITMELGEKEEKILQSPFFRRLILFLMIFVATKDFTVSVVITLIYLLLTKTSNGAATSGIRNVEHKTTVR